MKNFRLYPLLLSIGIMLFCGTGIANAYKFKDTSTPTKPITIGLRFGINSSNQGINLMDILPDTKKAHTEWKTGFDVGAVVNLNLNKFISIQPGFFFQNRSYDYMVINANFDKGYLANQFGHTRSYYFQIPVLLSLGFNINELIRWNIDAGPYFSFGLGGDNTITSYYTQVDPSGDNNVIINGGYKRDYFGDSSSAVVGMQTFDCGLKFGTSITFSRHFNLGFHYITGLKNVANQHPDYLKDASAKNKSWTVSIGYDF